MRIFSKICTLLLSLALCACTSDYTVNPDTSKGEVIGMDRNSNVEISQVSFKYFEDWQTRSVGEALTGKEHTYGHLTLRTQADSREGIYCFIMIDWGPKEILMASQIELYVDSNKRSKVRKYTFIIPETESVLREIKLGITGTDWTGSKEKVNAWKVIIKSPTGKVITQKQSWLWSIKDGEALEQN